MGVLGWGAYLACSWTWCIGMFLPALLVRDYGLWGFLVFAIPNVVGAAAMGWVIDDDASAFRRRHSRAIRAFSVATVVFQLFFLMWLATNSPIGVVLVLSAGVVALIAARGRGVLALAGAVWIASVGVGISAGVTGVLGVPPVRNDAGGLVWLAPVCVFGFLLCPYLDATFHRARAELPRAAARVAFTIGFGVMFLAMILLTLGYGADLDTLARALGGSGWVSRAIQAHIAVQLGFTIGVHIRDARWIEAESARNADRHRWNYGVLIGCGVAAAMLGIRWLGVWPMPWAAGLEGRITGGEVVYRALMGLYGLAFPAYVWLVVIASPNGGRGPSRARMRVWAAAVGIATPMFWKGFVDRQEVWLAPGILIVLASRVALPRTPERESAGARPSK